MTSSLEEYRPLTARKMLQLTRPGMTNTAVIALVTVPVFLYPRAWNRREDWLGLPPSPLAFGPFCFSADEEEDRQSPGKTTGFGALIVFLIINLSLLFRGRVSAAPEGLELTM